MKIYCLLIDAMPLVDEIKDFAKQNGFSISRQIGGCDTTRTLTGMFTGGLSSDLIHKGLGYHYTGRKDILDLKWLNDETIHLFDILKNKNYEIDIYGSSLPWLARDVLALPALSDSFPHPLETTKSNHLDTFYSFDMYDEALKNTKRLSHVNLCTSNPDGTKNRFTYDQMAVPELRKAWYKNDQDNIKRAQKKKKNTFSFWQSLEWSDHIWGSRTTTRSEAISNVIDWLNCWNTEEEDTFFWIFSDHGDNADDYMSPKSYMSWVITKDNTNKLSTSAKVKPVISNMDFYKTVLDKLDHKKDCKYSRSIYEDSAGTDSDRLYFFEDSRMHANVHESIACSVVKTHLSKEKDNLEKLSQISYHESAPNLAPHSIYGFHHDFLENKTTKGFGDLKSEEVNRLVKKLFERVSWLPTQNSTVNLK